MARNEYEKVSNDRSYRQNVHVRVAEEKLGRRLGKKEVVHHRDEDKLNNSPENLQVFRTEGDHQRFHSKIPCEVFQTSDGSYVSIKKQRECPNCLRLFEPDNNRDIYCGIVCYTVSKVNTLPSKEELQRLVNEMPATKVAKMFNVSDRAIGKWCEKLGVTKPGRGYWTKIQYSE